MESIVVTYSPLMSSSAIQISPLKKRLLHVNLDLKLKLPKRTRSFSVGLKLHKRLPERPSRLVAGTYIILDERRQSLRTIRLRQYETTWYTPTSYLISEEQSILLTRDLSLK